jgi:hypothetical protein
MIPQWAACLPKDAEHGVVTLVWFPIAPYQNLHHSISAHLLHGVCSILHLVKFAMQVLTPLRLVDTKINARSSADCRAFHTPSKYERDVESDAGRLETKEPGDRAGNSSHSRMAITYFKMLYLTPKMISIVSWSRRSY